NREGPLCKKDGQISFRAPQPAFWREELWRAQTSVSAKKNSFHLEFLPPKHFQKLFRHCSPAERGPRSQLFSKSFHPEKVPLVRTPVGQTAGAPPAHSPRFALQPWSRLVPAPLLLFPDRPFLPERVSQRGRGPNRSSQSVNS